MSTVQKIQVKLLSSVEPDVIPYVPVFHRWIRDNALSELLIDVVDYSHVQNGPEVLLVGHGADYALDREGGHLGLLFANKRDDLGENGFATALRRAFRAAALLESESGPERPILFRADELHFKVADRLSTPNDDASFRRLEPSLKAALSALYPGLPFELLRTGTSRELFSVQARISGAPAFSEAAKRAAAL
ncbi:MAG TPA: hypothetical protein VFQ61_05185 [Polyangiaceae bacterium]|nr:hypothetical protein [Polyangiaceae bacterium]